MEYSDRASSVGTRDRAEVLQGVVGVIAEQMGMDPQQIRETDLLEEDLGCDSLDIVEITMELEEHFGISVPDEFGEQIKRVSQVTDGVMQLLSRVK